MKLSVDYGHKKLTPEQLANGARQERNIETTAAIFVRAMEQSYPAGLDGNGPKRRMWGRIQRKLDEAVSKDKNEIELDDGELELLSKALNTAMMPLDWSRYICLLEDEIYQTEKPEKTEKTKKK